MVTSSLQAERRALEDILSNSTECLMAVSFGETFHTLHQRVDQVRFFHEEPDLFSVTLMDDMVQIFYTFRDDDGHLTSMNGACYITLVCYKTLFGLSCSKRRY